MNRSGCDGEGSTFELLVRARLRIATCGVVAQCRLADAGEFMTRFTPRGGTKVDPQWTLWCLMHDIEKLAHHGYAG